MSDFETFPPAPQVVTVAGTAVELTPIRLGELPRLLAALRPIAADLSAEPDWLDLLGRHGEAVLDLLALATRARPRLDRRAGARRAVALAAAVFEVNADFFVRRASFVASLQTKVFDQKPERLPALWVGSRIPWLGIHTHGGTVAGRMLIPLLPGRIGPKRFSQVIDGLMRSGNAFFVEKNEERRVLLMAEEPPGERRATWPLMIWMLSVG